VPPEDEEDAKKTDSYICFIKKGIVLCCVVLCCVVLCCVVLCCVVLCCVVLCCVLCVVLCCVVSDLVSQISLSGDANVKVVKKLPGEGETESLPRGPLSNNPDVVALLPSPRTGLPSWLKRGSSRSAAAALKNNKDLHHHHHHHHNKDDDDHNSNDNNNNEEEAKDETTGEQPNAGGSKYKGRTRSLAR